MGSLTFQANDGFHIFLSPPQCEVMMTVDGSGGASRTVLLSLFWALQGSLLSWCYLQLKGTSSTAATMDLARAVLVKCEILIFSTL